MRDIKFDKNLKPFEITNHLENGLKANARDNVFPAARCYGLLLLCVHLRGNEVACNATTGDAGKC